MVNFVCGPIWFLNADLIIEFISLLIALLIGIFSHRAFKFTNERKYFYFAIAFYLIAASFGIEMLATWLSCSQFRQVVFQNVTIIQYKINSVQTIYALGSFLHRFFMLTGLLILTTLCLKIKTNKTRILLLFFIFISTWFSRETYFIFHLIAAFLLLYISLSFYANHYRKQTKNSFLVSLAFALMFVSQLIFIFVLLDQTLYVAGVIVQIIGYLFLLLTYLLIGKK